MLLILTCFNYIKLKLGFKLLNLNFVHSMPRIACMMLAVGFILFTLMTSHAMGRHYVPMLILEFDRFE